MAFQTIGMMQYFEFIAMIFVIGGIASALVIAADERVCRQPMRIMNSVWILTGLWAGFFGLWAYFAFGRRQRCGVRRHGKVASGERMPTDADALSGRRAGDRPGLEMSTDRDEAAAATARATEGHTASAHIVSEQVTSDPAASASAPDMKGMESMEGMESSGNMKGMGSMEGMEGMESSGNMEGMEMTGMEMPPRPRWQSVVLSTLHCGAGCTLADLVGEWFLYFVPIAIGGSLVAGAWVVDYVLALIIGIGFQYAAIRGMQRSLSRAEAVRRAAKADILSLTAWQVGMYGWMSIVLFVLRDGDLLPRTSFTFWWMMQIAMVFGFLVSLPVNVLLIKYGIKKGM